MRDLTFFIDRDLGNKIFPDILRSAGISIERHTDHFAQDAKDPEWIPAVGERGWFVVTHDHRMRYKPFELDAIMRSGLGLFVLRGHAPVAELAENFLNTFERIRAVALSEQRPFIAKVLRPSPVSEIALGKPGRVELWLSKRQWRGR